MPIRFEIGSKSTAADGIVSDGIQVELGRFGWYLDPLSIDFQFNFSKRAQLPPTERDLGTVPSRNDARP